MIKKILELSSGIFFIIAIVVILLTKDTQGFNPIFDPSDYVV